MGQFSQLASVNATSVGKPVSIMANLRLLVLVATMAATATVSHGRHVDLSYMSEGYDYGYDVPTYTYTYSNDYLHPNNYYRSLHKRSPVTPFKPTNPFIKIPTLGLLTPIT